MLTICYQSFLKYACVNSLTAVAYDIFSLRKLTFEYNLPAIARYSSKDTCDKTALAFSGYYVKVVTYELMIWFGTSLDLSICYFSFGAN